MYVDIYKWRSLDSEEVRFSRTPYITLSTVSYPLSLRKYVILDLFHSIQLHACGPGMSGLPCINPNPRPNCLNIKNCAKISICILSEFPCMSLNPRPNCLNINECKDFRLRSEWLACMNPNPRPSCLNINNSAKISICILRRLICMNTNPHPNCLQKKLCKWAYLHKSHL